MLSQANTAHARGVRPRKSLIDQVIRIFPSSEMLVLTLPPAVRGINDLCDIGGGGFMSGRIIVRAPKHVSRQVEA